MAANASSLFSATATHGVEEEQTDYVSVFGNGHEGTFYIINRATLRCDWRWSALDMPTGQDPLVEPNVSDISLRDANPISWNYQFSASRTSD